MLVTHPGPSGSMAALSIPRPGLHMVLLGLIDMLTSQGKVALHRRRKGGGHPDAIPWSQRICMVTSRSYPHSKPSLQVWLENMGGGAI